MQTSNESGQFDTLIQAPIIETPVSSLRATSPSPYEDGDFENSTQSRTKRNGYEEHGTILGSVDMLMNKIRGMRSNQYGLLSKLINHWNFQWFRDAEEIVSLLENIVIFLDHFSQATSRKSKMCATVGFVKSQFLGGKSFIHTSAFSLLTRILAVWDGFDVQSGTPTFVSCLKDMIHGIDNVKNSQFVFKTRMMIAYLIGFGVLSKANVKISKHSDRFDTLAHEAAKSPLNHSVDFVQLMLEYAVFMCEKGWIFMKTGNFHHFFMDEDSTNKWVDKSNALIRQAEFLNDAELHNIDEHKYQLDMDSVIDEGVSMLKYSKEMYPGEKRVIKNLLASLQLTRSRLLAARSVLRKRPAPLAFLLAASSSVGKSYLTDLLYHHYAKVSTSLGKPLKAGADFKFVLNAENDNWDGFTSSKWFVCLDDIACKHPDKSSDTDETLKEILRVINNVPYLPRQAALEDKGKTPCLAKLVIGTTNTEDLCAQFYFNCPFAIMRRFRYIIVPVVKEQYAIKKEGFFMLDSAKVPPVVDGEYPNLWNFIIKEVEPVSGSRDRQLAKAVVHKRFDDINAFVKWFGQTVSEHLQREDKIDRSLSNLETVEICDTCFGPKNENEVCCVAVQCGTITEWSARSFWYYMIYLLLSLTTVSMMAIILLLDRVCVDNTPPFFVRWFRDFVMQGIVIMQRRLLRTMTDRIRAVTYGKAYVLLKWVGILSFLLALWRTIRYFQPSFGAQGSTMGKPVVTDNEPPNVWKNEAFKLSTFDLSPQILSKSTETVNRLKNVFAQQLCSMRVYSDGKMLPGRILALGGHLWVTNNHYMHRGIDKIEIIKSPDVPGLTENRFIKNPRMFAVPERDLVFIEIPDLPPKKSIIPYFLKEVFEKHFDGFIMGRDNSGKLKTRSLKCAVSKSARIKSPDKGMDDLYTCYLGSVIEPTFEGECGSLVWAKLPSTGPVALGIHVGGKGEYALSTPIIRKDIDRALAHFGGILVQSGEPNLEKKLLPLHPKSGLRYIRDGDGQVYGSLRPYTVRLKSRVEPTIIGDYVVRNSNESLFPIDYNTGPPVMDSWRPWRIAMDKMFNTNQHIDQVGLHQCAEAFLDNILEALPESEIRLIQVYDYNTAVNGAPGVSYVDKINRKSSAGYPWCKSKQFVIKKLEPFDDYMDPIDFDDSVKRRYNELLETYKKGFRGNPVFTAHLKDEPVSLAKIAQKKTRVFCGAPLDYTLVVRQYLLSVIRVVQRNRYTFECAVGAVAQSAQWNEIFEHLTHFGDDTIVAGDYSAFDKTMPPCVIRAAFGIILKLCEHAGYTQEDLMVVSCIMEDTAFPNVDMRSDLVQFNGTNPSGHPLTVIINSLANSLYMRYAYMRLGRGTTIDGSVKDFQKYVHLLTYGDDNIMGVSKHTPWFNHTAIQSALADIGIVYTMADKDSESVPYIHINEATFLKRGFVYDVDVGMVVGRLDHSSISKMLTMRVNERGVHPKEHAAQVIRTAMDEYFWYGLHVYRKQAEFLKRVVVEFELDEYAPQIQIIPNWIILYKRYVMLSAKLGFNPQDIVGRHSQGTVPHDLAVLLCNLSYDITCKSLSVEEEQESLLHKSVSDSCEDVPPDDVDPKSTHNMLSTDENVTCSGGVENQGPTIMEREQVPSGLSMWDSVIRHHPADDLLFEAQAGDTVVIPEDKSSGNVTSNKGNPEETTPQSTSLLTDMVNTTREQVVEFKGDTPSPMVEFAPIVDPTFTNDYTPSAELADFLSRPVLIDTITWTEGAAAPNSVLLPWYLFLNNPVIKRKIDNYNFLCGNLHVKAVVNASPFYYGSLLLAYTPLPAFYSDDALIAASADLPTQLSQKPHIWVLPQNNQAGEMELPFFYHKNWLDITAAVRIQEMGNLEVYEVVPLQNANGVTGDTINVNIYAWMDNVKLTGPTFNLAVQSGKPQKKKGKKSGQQNDEYSVGPVEKVSSVVASAAGYLTEVPVIGPFARVTELGASAVSHLAKIFGWTNPPVICNVTPVRNAPFHSFPSTEVSDAFDKLTLDPKNELCIDPRTVGLGEGDEMSLNYICGKEALLATTTWNSSLSTDTIIFSCPVQPTMYRTPISFSNNSQPLFLTPMAMVAQQFKYWRGDIEFRIQAVCTQYHKGRLRITWDPTANLVSNSATTSTSFTKIIDLEPDMNVSFRVSYLQALHWLQVRDLTAKRNYFRVTGDIFADETADGYTNGQITIRVLNELSSPVATSTVQLMVFVKGCSNLEFCNPENQIPLDMSYFVAQSGEWQETGDCIAIQGDKPKTVVPEQYSVYAGECVKSLRVLLRRTNCEQAFTLGSIPYDGNANLYVVAIQQTKYPSPIGYDPKGFFFAQSINAGPAVPYNFTSHTAFSDLVPCFVGMRGSMRWQYNFDLAGSTTTTLNTVRVDRETAGVPRQGGGNIQLFGIDIVGSDWNVGGTPFVFQGQPQGSAGQSLNNTRTQTGIAVECPHYYRTRFVGTNVRHYVVGDSADDTDKESYQVRVLLKQPSTTISPGHNIVMQRHYCVGTDFTTFFFLAVPILYAYTSRPFPQP
jgi:hypothetical protein